MSTFLFPRELFGGAIVMPIPAHYIDASDLRQIPDTQEVFLSPDSDTSIILEVLDPVLEGAAAEDLGAAISYHFTSLASDNSSHSSTILTPLPTSPPTILPTPSSSSSPDTLSTLPTPAPYTLRGRQLIRKFPKSGVWQQEGAGEGDEVEVLMALWRVLLPPVSSVPSSQAQLAVSTPENEEGWRKADLLLSVNVPLKDGEEEVGKVAAWWEEVVRGLIIKDYGLFEERE